MVSKVGYAGQLVGVEVILELRLGVLIGGILVSLRTPLGAYIHVPF